MTELASPCIDVCDVDNTGQYCIGCGRSMDEIARWLAIGDAERSMIMEKLPDRLKQLER